MGKRVLVIEDDDSIRESLLFLLEDEGYQVAGAQNGMEGLKVLEENRGEKPDLILLDLRMPQMNGGQFLEIQKSRPDLQEIPVAVFTAAGIKTKPELANDIIRKPIKLNDLLQVLEKYCQ